MTTAMKVVVAAGGTGGHIFPGLAIAEELLAAGAAVVWLGAGGMETGLVQKHGLPLYTVPYRPPRRWWQLPLLAPAVWRAWRVLAAVRPSAVLCMGGYAAVPAGLAAWLRRLPLIIHEQNAVLGKANRLLAKFSHLVLTGFPNAGDGFYVGNPVRTQFLQAAARQRPPRCGIRHVLVLGGSQGAQVLNDIVPEALALRQQAAGQLQITHQCGKGNGDAVRARYHRLSVNAAVYEFIEAVADAMAVADIVICRAGAATLAELAAVGVGAVLVPYPHAAGDHQAANAKHYSAHGAALLCAQHQLTAVNLSALLADADSARLAQAAATLAMPQAAAAAAARCLAEGRRAS